MDIKTIVADVAAACAQRWPDSVDASQQEVAVTLVARLSELKGELKQKKTEKQECARDFGAIKAAGGDLSAQKALMQQISSAIEHIEQQRKAIEGELVELFAPDDGDEASELSQPVRSTHSASSEIAVEIIEVSDSDAALWDAYVEAHAEASQYHLYRWRAVIARSFKHPSIYLAARDHDGRLRGILPLVRLRSRLFGDFAVSMPFFNYGGPLADNRTIAQKLLQSAATYARQLGLSHLEIRATSTLNDWPTRTDKVSMVLTLPESEEQLDADLGSKVRAQIKRAQHEETRVAIGHIDLLDDFYHVFAINMRDLGTPVYSKNFFRNILQERGDQAHIVIVYWRNRPVSAAFLLGYRDMMEIPWASTVREANSLNINMLLYRTVLGFCIRKHYRVFNFGRSSKDSGTYRFKKQWGARPVQHYWHYWLESGGALPELKPDSPKFRILIACWRKLPIWITKVIGPMIVKSLP